jgi:hypothetical protein
MGPAQDRLGSRRAEADDHTRLHQHDFSFEPWKARLDFSATWFLMNPPLPAFLKFEVLHYVSHVNIRCVNCGVGQRPAEQLSSRAYEWVPLPVFRIPRLFAD